MKEEPLKIRVPAAPVGSSHNHPISGEAAVFLLIVAQLAALLFVIRLFKLEEGHGLIIILIPLFVGFIIHGFLPVHFRIFFPVAFLDYIWTRDRSGQHTHSSRNRRCIDSLGAPPDPLPASRSAHIDRCRYSGAVRSRDPATESGYLLLGRGEPGVSDQPGDWGEMVRRDLERAEALRCSGDQRLAFLTGRVREVLSGVWQVRIGQPSRCLRIKRGL